MKQLSLLVISVVALVSGCGTGNAPVSSVAGNVTLQGQALTDCIVVFENKTDRVFVTAYTDEKGNYQSDKVKPGVFKVSVKPAPRYAEPGPGEAVAEIPENYRQAESSGLVTTIEIGENQYDLKLTE